MSEDSKKLPELKTPALPTSSRRRRQHPPEVLDARGIAIGEDGSRPSRFTDAQVETIIDVGGRAIDGALEIGKGIVDIVRIRETASADVRKIEARTEQLVRQVREQIDLERERRKTLRDRGNVVVDVINAVTRQIQSLPQGDAESCRQAIALLPELVRVAAAGE
jgi:hypothetical protein